MMQLPSNTFSDMTKDVKNQKNKDENFNLIEITIIRLRIVSNDNFKSMRMFAL